MTEEVIYEGKQPRRSCAFLGFMGRDRYKITTERVVVTKGIISRRNEEIELFRVRDINFSQTILARLKGIGKVNIVSVDATAPNLTLYLKQPAEWHERLRSLVNQEKERRGVTYRE